VTLPRPAVVVTPGENVPNPFVAVDGQEYVMFASQGAWLTPNVPFRVSSSPTSWGPVLGDALPNLPPWAGYGFTWAPDVRKVGDRFVMWFTALVKGVSPMTQCIGAAWSLYLVGPYQPLPAPAVCPLDHHGAIDPRMFAAPDGSLWLDWKTDDNADVPGDSHTTIYAQRLTPDGLTPAAPPVPLVTADLTWEGRIVEAPQMVAAAGHYWLFYSGNWFNQPAYGIGVARCDGPAGPCTKTLPQAWLGSDRQGQGPGEGSLFHDANGWWMVYAPWSAQAGQNVVRPVALAHIGFTAAGPYIIPPA
jgi:beta-xylosidase